MGCRVLKIGPSDQKFKRSYEFFSKMGGYAAICQANSSKKISRNRKKIPCFSAHLWYSLTMKKKYYTSSEVIEFATQNKAACTHASMAFRSFTFTNRVGRSCKVVFDRIDHCVWRKKIVK